MAANATKRMLVASIALLVAMFCLAAGAGALARRHQRNHRPKPTVNAGGGSGAITVVPNPIKLTGTGAFSTSINGNGLPAMMPVTINTSTLDAACTTSIRPPKVLSIAAGVAIPSTARTGTDGRFVGSLAGAGCLPGSYVVAVQEQAFPFSTFAVVLTLTL